MASFSFKPEKSIKCGSLNSPVFVRKNSRSCKLRTQGFVWDGFGKESICQSQINNNKFVSSEEQEIMESSIELENGCQLIQVVNEKISKLIQLPENICDASDNLVSNSLNHSTLVPNESNLPFNNTSPAIFTVQVPGFQILVVNSAACQLIRYSSDELCSMKLEDLIQESDKYKLSNLFDKFKNSKGETNGKLLNFVKKDGEAIVVSMYFKRLDSPDKCLTVVEPIDVKTGFISVDSNGKILFCDEELASLFQYNASECVGLNIYTLLPAIDLSKRNDEQWKQIKKQHISGRTKNGHPFPVCLTINYGISSLEYEIVIWVYPSLNGLILLNKNLVITDLNSYFIKLMFGFSKKKIINQSIVNLIPTFCRDVDIGKLKKFNCQSSVVNNENLSYWNGKNEVLQKWSENSLIDEYLDNLTSCSSLSFNMDSPRSSNWPNLCFRIDPERDSDIQTLFKHLNIEKVCEEKVAFPNGVGTEEETDAESNEEMVKNNPEEIDKVVEPCLENHQNVVVQEGKFLGFVQHCDGSYINIKYQVKINALSEESFYCVWLSTDFFRLLDLNKESNLNVFSSFNSTSFEGSLPKDSTCSGQFTKPSSASLISQCDENLTAGEYSQHYTNIRQIGKGAFGYVKMAFRDSDGLLVVTKFIKKQSINIRSWVFHSNLNMKIPLEISLLTTLHHPNIVKVLDVFHNDSFVQLVMEKHGAGFDLFEFINRGPQCDEKLKSYIFRQIISAVHYLDSLGILHRDIKDENVIINEKFEVKLIDFGSATFMPSDENFSKFYGTVEYCSPEVLLGNSYRGPELEIWSLGVTLYVLTFGENPFSSVEEIIEGQFSIPFQITTELDDLMHQMLEINVEKRITIDKVAAHSWINQPVSIENYRFEEVVNCSDEEAYPPRYVHEINLESLYSKDSRTCSNGLEDTINSNSSLQNLTEIEDLDDNLQVAEKPLLEILGSKTNGSSIVLSSTPVQGKNERLCKSATTVPTCLKDSLKLNESNYESLDGYLKRSLRSNYLMHFKNTSASEKKFDTAEEDIPGIDEVLRSELEMRLENCLLKEECYKMNNSSQTNVKEVYEFHSANNGGGERRVLRFEDNLANEWFKPN